MAAKTSPARRAAVMAAVAETGNQTIAVERAKVSRSWVHLHRSTDPAFRAELDAAIATAKASSDKLRTNGDGMKPPSGWRSIDGEELVVRAGNGRRTQIARARLKQWTPRAEARFLSAPAACCNVRAACGEVGLSVPSAYNHRHRWPEFSGRRDAALELGYARAEAVLVEHAGNMFSSPEVEPAIDMPPIRFDEGLQLLRLHQNQVRGTGRPPGALDKPLDPDVVRASLLKRVERIERTMARRNADPAADPADDRRELARGARIVTRRLI